MPDRPFWRQQGFSYEPFASALLKGHEIFSGNPVEFYRETDSSLLFWDHATASASLMTDTVTSQDANGDYTDTGMVDHIKVISSSIAGRIIEHPWDRFPWTGNSIIRINGAAPIWAGPGVIPSRHDRYCPLPPSSVTTPFAFKAVKEMASQFPPEVDILTYLAELKSLPSAITELSQIYDLLKSLGNGRFSGTLKQAAKAHASYNFGWSPLYGDSLKIYNVLKSVRARLEWLRKNKNKWVRVGSQTRYSDASEEGKYVSAFGYYGVGPFVAQYRKSVKGKMTCTARVRQNLPWVETWEGWVRGVISAGGMNRPFKVIWENLPFSWMVDYFIPIGDYLESVVFEDQTDWDIRDVCWSIRADYGYQLKHFDHEQNFLGDEGSYSFRRYRRVEGFPPRQFYLRELSFKQLSLLAAVGVIITE
jgi:hypothetical protein